MIKPRALKSLALLSLTAFLANISLNTLLPQLTTYDPSEQQQTLPSYDAILDNISRRLQLSPSSTRLSRIRSHHASLLIERGIDPKSPHFKELMRERMKRVNVVRRERGGERKVLRNLALGGEVWRGTPLIVENSVCRVVLAFY
jgi:hypothetical protein